MARTIRSGGQIGKSYSYVQETGEVTYSSDPAIKVGSNVYESGIRKNPYEKRPTDTDSNVNRIRKVANSITGITDPDDIMVALLESLTEGSKIPQPGKYYIFVYNAKTPQLRYDQNPFVAVSDIFAWGFRGLNFHWGEMRQYTWDEVAGGLYEVYPSEIKDLQMIPFANFKLNT